MNETQTRENERRSSHQLVSSRWSGIISIIVSFCVSLLYRAMLEGRKGEYALENEERVQAEYDRIGMREVRLRPPLLDETSSRAGVLDQSLMQCRSVLFQKVGDDFLRLGVIGGGLIDRNTVRIDSSQLRSSRELGKENSSPLGE